MEINYTTWDKSVRIKLVYNVLHNLKQYYVGKTYPKATQCLVYYNDELINYSTVVKHYKDADNQEFAYRQATIKALKVKKMTKWLRSEIWKVINEELSKSSF